MKNKKVYISIVGLFSAILFFTIFYYISYTHAFNKINHKDDEGFGISNADSGEIEESPYANYKLEDETIHVDANATNLVKPTTQFILETHDLKTQEVLKKELNVPGYLIGLSREGVMAHLTSYMENLSLAEYNKGLLSYDLIAFSGDKIILRKTYNSQQELSMFYATIKDGRVVIYHSDMVSIFKQTFINANDLSDSDREALFEGVYIKDLDELYSVLESYSS